MLRVLLVWLSHFSLTLGSTILLAGKHHGHSIAGTIPGLGLRILQITLDVLSFPSSLLIERFTDARSMEFLPYVMINSLLWALVINMLLKLWVAHRDSA